MGAGSKELFLFCNSKKDIPACFRLQEFQGIVERNSSVDEILSRSKEGFGFFKNLLMDRFYQHKNFYKPNYFSTFTTKVPTEAPVSVAIGLHFTFNR